MKSLEKVFDIIGEILAVLLVIVYAFAFTNAQWNYISSDILNKIVELARTYGSIVLMGIVGMEAMSKRSFVLRIIFYVLFAAIVIFSFFPDVQAYLVGMIG